MTNIVIRFIDDEEVESYRNLRLFALNESSTSFGSCYEQEKDYPLERFVSRLKRSVESPNGIIGAFDDYKNLVGMIGFSRDGGLKQRHIGDIWSMYVMPDYRSRGIGKKLLNEVILLARKFKLRQIRLTVTIGNASAQNLYKSFGFQVYGIEKDSCYENGKFYDEELMVLKL